jgi:hypothetical protein
MQNRLCIPHRRFFLFYDCFRKNAAATAPGPAWVPITLPMMVL